MKSRKIIASCFAGFGIYLVLSTFLAAVSAVTGTLWTLREMHEGWAMVVAQYAFVAVPLFIGLLFVCCAHWFAGVVSRAARISDDEVALPDSDTLLRVILASAGVVLFVRSGSFLGQIAYHVFVTRIGSAAVSIEAERQIPELTQSVALILQFVGSIVVIRNAASISRWFHRRWKSAA